MDREVNPNREKARQIYIERAGNITNRKIAEMLGEDEKKVAVWKQRDKWTEKPGAGSNVIQQKKANKKNVVQQKKNSISKENTKLVKKLKKEVEEINPELTEKQVLFVAEYLIDFNATRAAMAAGYSKGTAYAIGWENLRKPEIQAEIQRQTSIVLNTLGITSQRNLLEYLKIAFADITNYVSFGQKDVPVMSMFGPVKGEDGKPLTKTINYVDFNPSTEVDGTLISEVKQGKDGVSLKLHDKMKALEKLEKYTDLLPDRHKRRIETEKLKIEKERLELEKTKITIKDPNSDIGITVHFNIPRPDSAELKL